MNLSRKWNPKCLDPEQNEPLGSTSTGYIIPCCYCDINSNRNNPNDILLYNLYDVSLKLENNDSIDDIILSDHWKSFYDAIDSGPEQAPLICKRICFRTTPINELKTEVN